MLLGHSRLTIVALFGTLAVMMFGIQAASARAALEFESVGAFGPDGTSASGFSQAGSVAVDQEEEAVYVLDGSANALFKFDFEGNPVDFGGSNPDVFGNELSGLSIGGGLGQRQVAVNAETHVIYLTGGNDVTGRATALQAFEANGEPALFTAGPGEGTNEIGGLPGIRGVAVDTNGNIYVSGTKEGGEIVLDLSVYSPSGALLLPDALSLTAPANIAVDTNGVLYVLQNNSEAERYTPSEYPVTPTTTYTGPDSVDPKEARSVAIDPMTNRLYVVQSFADDGTPIERVAVFDEEGTLEAIFAGPEEAGELERPYGIAVANVGELGGKGDIAKPFVSHNPEGGLAQVEMFKEHIVVAAPTVESTAASSITGDSATLRAKINPNNRDTSYWFEYGLQDCELGPCSKVPLIAAPIGSGRKGVNVSQPIAGLTSKSTYHYRVVAENVIDTTEGPDKTFTTQGSGLGFVLGDSRVWEMVSPPKKFNGQVVTDDTAIVQASATGGALAYPSLGSIVAEPLGSRSPQPASVLAKRDGGGGWASEDLTPPHTEVTQVSGDTEFKLFTPDLLRAAMTPIDETPLSPEASEQTPYLWSDGDPALFEPLVNPTNVSPGIKFGPKAGPGTGSSPISIEGASADLDHVVVSSENPLLENAPGGSVYLWSEGGLEAVSELPEGGGVVEGLLGAGIGSVRNAVSSDGTRVFWAEGQYGFGGIGTTALYLRDTVVDESVRLDVVQGGSGEGANLPAFTFASADGSVVFFTDSQQLTADASPKGRDLYRCEIGQVEGSLGCAELTDVSGQTASPGESAGVFPQVSAATDDGTRLFFTARGVLDQAPNQKGDSAVPGQPNLYVWDEGEGLRFVATLSDSDFPVWGGSPNVGFAGYISADVSPSGRFFTFTSEQSLTGQENHNGSDKPTTEAFLYDTETEDLTCVSCNPAGAGPVGELLTGKVNFAPDPAALWANRWVAATLPEASETGGERSLYHPRTVLDNGRVFFNSSDPLVPADSNGNWDVYQWQPLGVGSCSEGTSAAATVRSGEGCIGLVSSGTSEGDAGFLDATPSGSDVFFETRGRLSALDFDDEVDVYDARVNGIAAQLPSNPECQGEACQPPAFAPNDPTPASSAFQGAGNIKPKAPKHCPKGKHKVRRGGKVKCIPRKKANHNRRASR